MGILICCLHNTQLQYLLLRGIMRYNYMQRNVNRLNSHENNWCHHLRENEVKYCTKVSSIVDQARWNDNVAQQDGEWQHASDKTVNENVKNANECWCLFNCIVLFFLPSNDGWCVWWYHRQANHHQKMA